MAEASNKQGEKEGSTASAASNKHGNASAMSVPSQVDTRTTESSSFMGSATGRLLIHALAHVLCLAIFIVPIVFEEHAYGGGPTLDEAHVMNQENANVHGYYDDNNNGNNNSFILSIPWTALIHIFKNDYWGLLRLGIHSLKMIDLLLFSHTKPTTRSFN